MTITLANWRDTLLDIGAIHFPRPVEAHGAFMAFIGSRPAYAKVVLKFEPADAFRVDATALKKDSRTLSYVESIAFGALDVLMTNHAYAMSKVKITILNIEEDEVESTPHAFRLAAREATRKASSEIAVRNLI